MNKKLLGLIVTVVAVLAIGGVIYGKNMSNDSSSDTDMAGMDIAKTDNNPFTNPNKDMSTDMVQSGTVKMNIEGFAYSQMKLKIKQGTTVTWTNKDDARHDITPDEASDNFMPSELLAKGKSYSYTFKEVGTYAYHCSPHPYMKATVEVVAQ